MAERVTIEVKRAYEPASPDDGLRVLADRLWPRGVSKSDAAIDIHAKQLAPSPDLRRWFGHDPERFEEFRQRYLEELEARDDAARELLRNGQAGRITLLYAARDTEHNHAVVLRDYLRERAGQENTDP